MYIFNSNPEEENSTGFQRNHLKKLILSFWREDSKRILRTGLRLSGIDSFMASPGYLEISVLTVAQAIQELII